MQQISVLSFGLQGKLLSSCAMHCFSSSDELHRQCSAAAAFASEHWKSLKSKEFWRFVSSWQGFPFQSPPVIILSGSPIMSPSQISHSFGPAASGGSQRSPVFTSMHPHGSFEARVLVWIAPHSSGLYTKANTPCQRSPHCRVPIAGWLMVTVADKSAIAL